MTQPPNRGPAAPPATLGKYTIQRQLGRGGMGVVYEAVDTALGRKVALKLMVQTLHADPKEADQEKERFLREGHLAATLPKHAHIVGIYEAGIAAGERYLAMEYIDGAPMSEWAKNRKASTREQVVLLRDTALAVHHAHEHGVIHRDLKPANILVDREHHPHVTDFGLAKLVGPKAQVSLTGSGCIVGTPAYISPEQARGLKSVDRRTDVYALGVILYEILAGRPPFEGPTAIEILMKAIKNPAPPPSSFIRRGTDLAIGSALEKIALKCLSKNPADRYPTAQAFAADLDRWLQGRDVRVSLPSTRRNTIRRAPTLPIAAILGTILLGVGALVLLSATGSRDAPEEPLKKERDQDRERKALEDRAREATKQLQELKAKLLPAVAGKDRGALRTGLIGQYFTGVNFDLLNLRRIDPQIRLEPGAPPWPGAPPDFFTTRWTGYVDAPATGSYFFQFRGRDGVRLFIDGTELLSEWGERALATESRAAFLEKGLHRILIEHSQFASGAEFSCSIGQVAGSEAPGAMAGLLHDPTDFTAVSGRTTGDESDRATLPGAQEAEALKTLYADGGGTFKIPWGRGEGCLVWGPTVSLGHRLELEFTAPEAKRRTVILALTRNFNHGIFKISINGQVIRDRLDLYHPRGQFLEFEFKNVDLTKGANQLEFLVVGTNPNSRPWPNANTVHVLGFDYLRLR